MAEPVAGSLVSARRGARVALPPAPRASTRLHGDRPLRAGETGGGWEERGVRQGQEGGGEADGGMSKGTQATCKRWSSDRVKNQKREDKTQNKNKHQIIFEIQSKFNTNNYMFRPWSERKHGRRG